MNQPKVGQNEEPLLIKCPNCHARNKSVMVCFGGLVPHEGEVQLLQVLPEEDVFVKFRDAETELDDHGICSECDYTAEVRDYLVQYRRS